MITAETEHPSGDLIVPVVLDPAIAARIEILRAEWANLDLSSTLSDLILIGLISINRSTLHHHVED